MELAVFPVTAYRNKLSSSQPLLRVSLTTRSSSWIQLAGNKMFVERMKTLPENRVESGQNNKLFQSDLVVVLKGSQADSARTVDSFINSV